MSRRSTAVLLALITLTAAEAEARPAHRKALADYLGLRPAQKLADCRTCHVVAGPEDDPEEKPHNAFGARLKAVRGELRKAGSKAGIAERIGAIADEDSDGDGVGNLLELLAGRYPGEPGDRPAPEDLPAARRALAEFRTSGKGPEWSPFEPVRRPEVPVVGGTSRVRNPIDAFLAVEREGRGLVPRPEADRAVLLRRVTLDLTGLPPTPEELHAFLDDPSADA
jgi:hypothetical protein